MTSTARTETLWPAPAKLNLFLHIVGRRADGYHELQTVFQLIDLCDTIGITLREDGRIERTGGLPDVAPEEDLTVRAARALQTLTDTTRGASIRPIKRIPIGGGLGGGSSDAATTLLALNKLWGTKQSTETLAKLGLSLGADVPVFIHGTTAWAEGLGERLTSIERPQSWFLVLHPGVSVATREVFQAPELTRNSLPLTMRAVLASGSSRNDCEAVVRARFPEVSRAFEWLGRWASPRLTGTGSCLFAEFASAAQAERVAARVPDEWQAFVARGLARSPLHDCLIK
jgi:4-diphosphocytidyl-2-C-methyl-D-erythritol kinase